MPLTLGNECAGVIEKTGADVTDFEIGDRVYTRLPLKNMGAFAEYAVYRNLQPWQRIQFLWQDV